MRTKRGVVAATGVACLVLSGTAFAGQTGGGASDEGPFFAVAAGDAVRVNVTIEDYVVIDRLVDAGSLSAQALLDDRGNTLAYAGAVWPGEDTLALATTVGGLGGLPVPDYPLAAQSSAGRPESSVQQGPIALAARSKEFETWAKAQFIPLGGGGVSVAAAGAEAKATRVQDRGATAAEASTTVRSFVVGDVLAIGGLESQASVRGGPGEPLQRTSTLEISGMTIAGRPVGFSGGALTLAGSKTPLPAGNPAGKALADHGITLTYLAPSETADGIVSAGIAVRLVRAVPSAPRPLIVTLVLGRASAQGRPSRSAVGPGDLPGGIVDRGGPDGGSVMPATGTAEIPGAPLDGSNLALPATNTPRIPARSVAAVPGTDTTPTLPPVLGSPPPGRLVANGPPSAPRTLAAAQTVAPDATTAIFLVLLVAAFAVMGGVFLTRVLAGVDA